MTLPGETNAEFIQMLPFTPRQKDNLAAWMVARSDGEHYGKLMVFQFPKQKVVFGPRQVVARINQDQVISPQITLWNQQGSEVIQGTLLVIPIEESLIYIRPLYLRPPGGKIPELKRVIVAYQNQIVMEETLELALNRIFPPGDGRQAGPGAAGTRCGSTTGGGADRRGGAAAVRGTPGPGHRRPARRNPRNAGRRRDDGAAHGRRTGDLRARALRATRRRLGAIWRRDRAARRDPRPNVERAATPAVSRWDAPTGVPCGIRLQADCGASPESG